MKLEGHCMENQIDNKLKKDASRSDELLSSYSCSKFEKCSFEKNAFKDKSTDFIVIISPANCVHWRIFYFMYLRRGNSFFRYS